MTAQGKEPQAQDVLEPRGSQDCKLDDLLMPKSLVARLAGEVLPAEYTIHKDAMLALRRSATLFISYLSSRANETCRDASRKALAVSDVIEALQASQFGDFVPGVRLGLENSRVSKFRAPRPSTGDITAEISDDENKEQQTSESKKARLENQSHTGKARSASPSVEDDPDSVQDPDQESSDDPADGSDVVNSTLSPPDMASLELEGVATLEDDARLSDADEDDMMAKY